MKSAETFLACCVVGLACFIGGQAVGLQRSAAMQEASGAIEPLALEPGARSSVTADSAAALSTPHGDERLVASAIGSREDRPFMSPVDMRRRLRLGLEGTYMGALLASRDSAIARWPDRTTRPLRVFIRDGERIEGWNPDFLPVVRDAFDTWVQANIPVRFTFVVDSATADVHVSFVRTFSNGISGKTIWSRDAGYWLVSGDIQLALMHPGGSTVTPPQLRAIALHEVGHLLGLDHAASLDDIMSSRVRVRELSESDRSTVRLLYAVPAGSVKETRE